MRRFILGALVISGAALLVLATIFYTVYRPWQLTWGSTDEEVERAMPGDELIQAPYFNATRAVTIEARPEQIWPWLVQIGYRRAGFYSHDWLDNDAVPSAERILPEYQSLAVGDTIPLSKSGDAVVRELEPNRFMVLVYPEVGVPWMTWTWGLYEQDSGQTRLVTRLRVDLQSTISKLWWDAFEIVMMRKCLLGIKRRVEAHPLAGQET
jgi:hypothetical protein